MKSKLMILTLLAASIGLAAPAHAQLGDIAKSFLGGSDSKAEKAAPSGDHEELVRRFVVSMVSMSRAQEKTLEALGYKDQAAAAKAQADHLSSGNVMDKDSLKKSVKVSNESTRLIKDALAKKGALSDEGKLILASAMPFYASGVAAGIKLPGEFEKWASQTKEKLNNPMDMLGSVGSATVALYVASKVPDLVGEWVKSTKNILAFAQANGVNVKDVAKELGDL